MTSGSRDYGRFDELAEEFAKRYRRGEHPSLEEYIARLPDMADEIREMFPALVAVEQVEAHARDDALERQPAVPALAEVGDYRAVKLWEAAPEAVLAAPRGTAAPKSNSEQPDAHQRSTREALRPTLSTSSSNLALAAWEAHDVGRLRFLLDLMKSREDESDVRG